MASRAPSFAEKFKKLGPLRRKLHGIVDQIRKVDVVSAEAVEPTNLYGNVVDAWDSPIIYLRDDGEMTRRPSTMIPAKHGSRPIQVLWMAIRAISAATGIPEDLVTGHVLADAPLRYPPASLSARHYYGKPAEGKTISYKTVTLTVRSPELSADDMRKLHAAIRAEYEATNKKPLSDSDEQLVRLVHKCAATQDELRDLNSKLFQRVADDLAEAGIQDYQDWRGPYQKYLRVLERLKRTFTVSDAK